MRFVSRYDLLFPHLFFSFFVVGYVEFVARWFCIRYEEKKEFMFLEDSEDLNGDRGELS